ncbi:MAG: glucosaminidase domain-containing protein [Parabacteroides sp.]
MKSLLRFSFWLLCFTLVTVPAGAESHRKLTSYQKYIQQYSLLAVKQQQQYKIPASITLAQGLLESGAGMSDLARRSNNHFGIKCHDWKGASVSHDDDERGECFRKYDKVEDSYIDHSKFLTERPRYAPLFKLNIKDYKGWAKGLQKCGYATDRAYANKLIKVIEDYSLYRFDSAKLKKTKKTQPVKPEKQPLLVSVSYQVYRTNGLIYVYAKENDSFEQIAASLGFKVSQLKKYNEVPEDFPLQAGDIVYLQKKKSKADKPKYDHVVGIGESLHSISQKYGIQIKSLYKLNHLSKDYVPEEGDVLLLR